MKSQCAEGNSADDVVEEKLVKLLESQTLATIQQRQYTDEEKRVRDAILAQYSQVSIIIYSMQSTQLSTFLK